MSAPNEVNWRDQRRAGMAIIAGSMAVSLVLGLVLYRLLPPIAADTVAERMILALKCVAVATLFCFVTGIEAIAHERLQGAAFDPLAGHVTKRMQVNLRYLQNTLEQLIVFAVGLFGLAAYLTGGDSLRALPVLTALWVLNRFAFWIGYHRSAAMRGLGAPSMVIGLLMLLYVASRTGGDIAGSAGSIAMIGLYLAIEAVLFWKTR